MQKESLTALVRHHLETASTASSGRSGHTIYGGHERVLSQTLIALRAGSNLDEHENPGKPPSRSSTAASPWWRGRTDGTGHPATSCSCPTPGTHSRLSRTPWCS